MNDKINIENEVLETLGYNEIIDIKNTLISCIVNVIN